MTVRFLLDTNVLSEEVSAKPNDLLIARLKRHAGQCAMSTLTWGELLFGCERLPDGRRRRTLDAYLHEVLRPRLPILPYDEAASTWHARERARLDAVGKQAPFIDGQIASIAATNNLVLVTHNTKDFARFRGIEIIDWSKSSTARS